MFASSRTAAEVGYAQRPRSRRFLAVGLALGAVVAAGIVVGILAVTDAGDPNIEPGVPAEASDEDLRAVAEARGTFYWAGPMPGTKRELTTTGSGKVYVRYLSPSASDGDPRPAFLTVGTYPFDRAYHTTRAVAKRRGTSSARAPGGGLAVWNVARPTSVYVAFPGADRLVEVFDPDPRRARDLALSGEVGTVR